MSVSSRIINKFNLTRKEEALFKRLNTPEKIQNYLDKLPFNFEKKGETYMSPRRTIAAGKAHCLEGALVAALALWFAGKKPLIMDLKTCEGDDHIIALFQRNGYWGAISKTNHAVLRYREPIYRTPRELAISYFHEYFNYRGKKILRSFSQPFDLSKLKRDWVTAPEELFWLSRQIDRSPHESLINRSQIATLRKADPIEIRVGDIPEWK